MTKNTTNKSTGGVRFIKESNYISAFSFVENNEKILKIIEFYLYKSANEFESPLSLKLNELIPEEKDKVIKLLLDLDKESTIQIDFGDPSNRRLDAINLSDDNYLNSNIPRGFCRQKPTEKHVFDCLFSHIRNSFAHGRIALFEDKIILEDKFKKQLTARIILSWGILSAWKEIIENFLAQNTVADSAA